MKTTKKEQAIKDINVKELNANWRTAIIITAFVSIALGLVGGYFAAINVITDSQSKAIQVVSEVSALKK